MSHGSVASELLTGGHHGPVNAGEGGEVVDVEGEAQLHPEVEGAAGVLEQQWLQDPLPAATFLSVIIKYSSSEYTLIILPFLKAYIHPLNIH